MSGIAIAIALILATTQTARPGAENPRASLRPELRVQMGHAGGTTFIHPLDAAFSADGRLLATGATDATARLWDAASGLELRSFGAGGDMVGAVSLSPDGSRLATVDFAGVGRLWNTATGAEILRFSGETHDVMFAPNGNPLTVDSRGIAIHNPAGRLIGRRLNAATGPVAFPEGRIASVCADGSVRTWNAANGAEIHRSRAGLVPQDRAVALSPDGRFAVIGGPDETVVLKDARTGAEVRRFTGHTSQVLGAAFSPDGRLLATHAEMNDTAARVWDVETGREIGQFGTKFVRCTSIVFTPDSRAIVVATQAGDTRAWDVKTGGETVRYEGRADIAWPARFSSDGAYLVTEGSGYTRIWSLATGGVAHSIRSLDPEANPLSEAQPVLDASGRCLIEERAGEPPTLWRPAAGTPPGQLVAETSPENLTLSSDRAFALAVVPDKEGDSTRDRVDLWRMPDGAPVARFDGVSAGVLSSDGSRLLLVSAAGLEIVETRTPERRRRLKSVPVDGTFVLSPDGRMLARLWGRSVELWDVQRDALLRRLKPGIADVLSAAFSSDGELLTAGGHSAARVWKTSDGTLLHTLQGPEQSSTQHVAISPDGRHVVTGGAGPARFWDLETGALVCTLVTFREGGWAVVDSEGRFDASSLETPPGLHWIVPDDPYRALPLEVFMRDYYEPRLLPRLLSGDELPAVRDLSSLNRLQPVVRILSVRQNDTQPSLATVQVEVTQTRRGATVGMGPDAGRSGVFDVRLFRDGQLAGYAPDRDGPVTLDPLTGSTILTFDRIRLPAQAGRERIEFSAHAFNVDGVKSATARFEHRVHPPLAPVKGTAFVIGIGVNTYDDPAMALRFAANDARRMQRLLAENLRLAGEYDDVIDVGLVSDGETRHAVKSAIEAVFGVLAGRPTNPEALQQIPNAGRLRAARPEDLVVISFAGHGYAGAGGAFYLVPSDVGSDAKARIARTGSDRRLELSGTDGQTVLSRCISSAELALWLRDVDAGEMALIIDACQSGAFAGETFKPGPMGSRGLGQLAYDKRMRVLAATQADNVAIEHRALEHGLVSYVLLEEGLSMRRADRSPADGRLTLPEWLRYAVDRVPGFFTEIMTETERTPVAGAPRLLVLGGASRPVQRPALFDFSTRRDVVIAP